MLTAKNHTDRPRTNPPGPVYDNQGDGVITRHGLVVGCAKSKSGEPNGALLYCSQDAKRVGHALGTRGYKLRILHDEAPASRQPTHANVLRELRKLVRKADADDLIFVHFSCHGKLIDDRPYLILQDATMGTEGLPVSKVLEILHGGRCRWVVACFDVCHVGLGLDPETVDSTRKIANDGGGFALLAGGASFQKTLDSDILRGGVFSNALAEGLQGAAAEQDGRLMFSALAQYVREKVEEWTRSPEGQSKCARQLPVMRIEGADPEVARSRTNVLNSLVNAVRTGISYLPRN